MLSRGETPGAQKNADAPKERRHLRPLSSNELPGQGDLDRVAVLIEHVESGFRDIA